MGGTRERSDERPCQTGGPLPDFPSASQQSSAPLVTTLPPRTTHREGRLEVLHGVGAAGRHEQNVARHEVDNKRPQVTGGRHSPGREAGLRPCCKAGLQPGRVLWPEKRPALAALEERHPEMGAKRIHVQVAPQARRGDKEAGPDVAVAAARRKRLQQVRCEPLGHVEALQQLGRKLGQAPIKEVLVLRVGRGGSGGGEPPRRSLGAEAGAQADGARPPALDNIDRVRALYLSCLPSIYSRTVTVEPGSRCAHSTESATRRRSVTLTREVGERGHRG